MKFIIGIVFLLGVTFGASGFNLELSLQDIARHECESTTKGNVVILNSVFIEDPLSENTCGDMRNVGGVDL